MKTPNGNLRVATLNVGTLRGKEEELVSLMQERRIDVLGLCETKLAGKRSRTLHENYQPIFSGAGDTRHGVGVMLSEELSQRVTTMEQRNERILSYSIKLNRGNISFIQVYVPQQGRPV